MTDIATFTNEQLIAVCRADVAEMSKFLKEGEFSNPSRAAMYLRITEIALAALMWDAQRRAGITDEQITQAMIDKLAVNKARQWPEPKDGEPRMHLRSEDESLNARRRRNRESNARARERETPAQRKARLAKNRLRMALRRKGGAK
ncbi:hypothetical protein BME05_27195 [Klebsiella quasipneumoniae subsp. quasipneumoniae]|nr:DUF550 domain-containing protein [Klebsiella pneumoniae]OVU91446.1 hypothetical protein BME05_27195 [Klebsiella quasipneumoniae subsp. quasipneumoniae]